MLLSTCERCGGQFWETYRGARAETSDHGQDPCDDCETPESNYTGFPAEIDGGTERNS